MPNKNNGGGKTYSAKEKQAYYAGLGYGACMDGKAIPLKTEEEKASFRNGLKKSHDNAKNYPNRRGGNK